MSTKLIICVVCLAISVIMALVSLLCGWVLVYGFSLAGILSSVMWLWDILSKKHLE